MRNIYIILTCVVAATATSAFETVDLQKIERRIAKEPAYAAQPLYGLLVLGAEAQTRVWMVLDKSKPDAERYDVLYADLNANADLTDSAERFVGQDGRFVLPDWKDRATGATHTDFSIRLNDQPVPTVMLSMKWRNGFTMAGGYPEDPANGYMKFGDKPAAAPILWVNGDGPFRFQRWYRGKLTIGGQDDFKVFVGQQGVGANSFWAFQVHFLPPTEGVQATLIYQDTHGQERRESSRLNDRC